MTAEVFESAATDQGDDALGIRNTLSIETPELSDEPVVRVDTNYKSTRMSDYPVDLSLVDAVKASAALLRAILEAYDGHLEDNPKLTWDLLRELLVVDNDVAELRELLTINLKPDQS